PRRPRPPEGERRHEAPPAPLWRRLPVLLAVGAAIVVAVVIAAVLLFRGSSNAFPNAAESRLLALVPSAIRSKCIRLRAPAAATTGTSCAPLGQRVEYYAFSSPSAANRYYAAQLPALYRRDRGSCSGLPLVGERPYAISGKTGGRVFCALDSSGGTATIGWTDDHAKTFARALRNDGNQRALYRWWAASAGPLESSGAKGVPRRNATVPSGGILFADTFSTPATGWPQVDNKQTRVRYAGGAYLVLVKPPRAASLPSTALLQPPQRPLSFGDAEVQLDASRVSSPGLYSFGIVCRASSAGLYRLEVRSDGVFVIWRSVGGKLTQLAAKPFGGRVVRSTNHVRAACIGGRPGPVRLRLTVNGGTLAAIDRHPIAVSGGVGVDAVGGAKGNAEIRFDNFVVRKQ
ncbi:MAG: hypothetical protein WBB74_06445, partial [Gaiellaceae bacterium]